MFYPSLKEFLKLSGRFNVVPVYKQINGDLDTPVSAFLKLEKNGYAFLFESVEGQEKVARFSFLGSQPELIFSSKGKNIRINYGQGKQNCFTTKSTPFDEIARIMRGFRAAKVKGLPRFYGGLVGYASYDMVRFIEDIPDTNPDGLDIPDCVFMLTSTLLLFDHLNHTIKIVSNAIFPDKSADVKEKTRAYQQAVSQIEEIHARLSKPLSGLNSPSRHKIRPAVKSNFSKAEFKKAVLKCKKYINAGDIIQVVPSQRLTAKIGKPAFDVYRSLRSLNPSPYMFFLQLPDYALAGASPEMLVRLEDGTVSTRPIAGTRPRGRNLTEDNRLAAELLNDKKEKAEHLMLVDLGRNDLGRVCKAGKVSVSEFMKVEKYSHVMHLVSEVRGALDGRYDYIGVLKSCFPAGTVTGSPKIRAMEIIDEIENIRRGPYAGCVGYFSFSRNMDTCITIRTVIIKDNTAYIQAGAGIVADSVPEREYSETMNKAKAMLEAIS